MGADARAAGAAGVPHPGGRRVRIAVLAPRLIRRCHHDDFCRGMNQRRIVLGRALRERHARNLGDIWCARLRRRRLQPVVRPNSFGIQHRGHLRRIRCVRHLCRRAFERRIKLCAHLVQHRYRAYQVHHTPHFHTAFAAHPQALTRLSILGAGHHRPAFGHIGRGIRPGCRANLKHIARCHGRLKGNLHRLVAARHQHAHAHALVARALKAHELRARGAAKIRIGKSAVE